VHLAESPSVSASTTWSIDRAARWAEKAGWLVGCNYNPAYAGNQLEMWQPETFDPAAIDRELALAESIGFNSLRVFLHDLCFAREGPAYLDRIERVLDLAAARGIGLMPVFFDSVWHPFPVPGPQRPPEPGVHNSMWLQSPGVEVLRDTSRFLKLETYVRATVKRFARDPRIHLWDLWNEPDNNNLHSHGPRDLGGEKPQVVLPLLATVFDWVHGEAPSQPATSGIWLGNWAGHDTLTPIERLQIERSDVVSFHSYAPAEEIALRIAQLRRYNRPILCTEFMARGNGSTFAACLPVLREHGVGAYCWGFVQGRTQTHLPWDSWQRPYRNDPSPWFHEVFRADHTPYDPAEVEVIRSLTRGGR
jgi:hypothetical protein